MLHKEKHNLEILFEWGTCIFVFREGHSKLDEKADEGHWVGYGSDSQCQCIYWLRKHHVTVEWNITFDAIVHVQQGSMAEGEQYTPGINQTPASNPIPTHVTPPPNASPPDPLQDLKPKLRNADNISGNHQHMSMTSKRAEGSHPLTGTTQHCCMYSNSPITPHTMPL